MFVKIYYNKVFDTSKLVKDNDQWEEQERNHIVNMILQSVSINSSLEDIYRKVLRKRQQYEKIMCLSTNLAEAEGRLLRRIVETEAKTETKTYLLKNQARKKQKSSCGIKQTNLFDVGYVVNVMFNFLYK